MSDLLTHEEVTAGNSTTELLVASGLRPVVEAALQRRDQAWWEQMVAICGRVANGFEAADPQFDRVEFLAACGLHA